VHKRPCIAAAVVALGLAGPVSAFAADCPRIEVARVAVAGETASSIPGPDGKRILVQSPIVTLADVTGASLSHADGQDGIGFTLSRPAGQRLRAFTTKNVGAQLAFVIDGRARMVAKVLDPLKGDAVWISPFPPAEGTALAGRVNACVKRK
jgi:preprotein translocase subunit SecD